MLSESEKTSKHHQIVTAVLIVKILIEISSNYGGLLEIFRASRSPEYFR